jgi:multiple sugar transport system permease protein
LVIAVPTLLAFQYSFYEAKSFVSSAKYVGLGNFEKIMHDQNFWDGLGRTIVYAGASVALQMVLGIAIALVLNQPFKGNQFLRGATVVPYIIPVVVVTIGWEWILDYDTGIVNEFIAALGFSRVQFLSVDLAMFTSIMLSTWAWTPFVTLVFLSGLQTIPDELYESAMLDGAGRWRQFVSITLPSLKELIIMTLLLRGIWMFNKLDLINLLTGGGPLQRTETLPIYIYHSLFKLFNVGYGSALAVISFVIMMVALAVYLRIFNEKSSARKWRKRFRRERGEAH